MKFREKQLIFIALSCVGVSACSGSSARHEAAPPDWIRQPTRTVEGGYIVYIGTGEDRASERANFKAEAMAIEDLANECSFAPKGTRVEDHYDQTVGIVHRVYAKVALSFQECEEAKKSVTPAAIRNLASVQFTEEVKRYQSLVDHVDESDVTGEEPADDDSDNDSDYKEGNPQIHNTTIVAINDTPHYYWARQQMVYSTQTVILAPVSAYPPNAPQTVQTTQLIQAQRTQVRNYEVQHPQLAKSPTGWSNVRAQAVTRMRQRQGVVRPNRNTNRNQNRNRNQNYPGQNRKRRRRQNG